jgi:hypothetical protein
MLVYTTSGEMTAIFIERRDSVGSPEKYCVSSCLSFSWEGGTDSSTRGQRMQHFLNSWPNSSEGDANIHYLLCY